LNTRTYTVTLRINNIEMKAKR